MKKQEIKFKNSSYGYSVIIGKNLLPIIPKKIKTLCPSTKKIVIIFDKKVPAKFKKILNIKLRKYKVIFLPFDASEKKKSFTSVDYFKRLLKEKRRSDLIISLGGGITGDTVGFIASIYKRGINFINIPTTLLAQVDSAIGGKTGVNSIYGKNLIGSFYQPKLVINDTSFFKTLPKKEMICGYAEILKHSLIKDKISFLVKKNTSKIIQKNPKN